MNFYPNDRILFVSCTSIVSGTAMTSESEVCGKSGKYPSVSYYNQDWNYVFFGIDNMLKLPAGENTFCLCYKPFPSDSNSITFKGTNYATLLKTKEGDILKVSVIHNAENDAAPEIKYIHPENPGISIKKSGYREKEWNVQNGRQADYPSFTLNLATYVTSDAGTSSRIRLVKHIFDAGCFRDDSDVCSVLDGFFIISDQVIETTSEEQGYTYEQGSVKVYDDGSVDFAYGVNQKVDFDDSLTNNNGWYSLLLYGKTFKNANQPKWLFTDQKYTDPVNFPFSTADFLILEDYETLPFIPIKKTTIQIHGRDFNYASYTQPGLMKHNVITFNMITWDIRVMMWIEGSSKADCNFKSGNLMRPFNLIKPYVKSWDDSTINIIDMHLPDCPNGYL
jgi:hypothetical protein